MTEKITESIVNLTAEITTIVQRVTDNAIASLRESLNNYVSKNDVKKTVDNNNNTDPVTGKSVVDYVATTLNGYTSNTSLATTLENYATTASLDDYVTETEFQNTFTEVIGANLEGHSFKFPVETQTPINQLITAGYYKYIGEYSTFICAPYDTIPYVNSLIRVERQSNHIIQHIYSTSPDTNNNHKIDGREFIRHGYLTTNNNNETVTNWNEWKVSHLPWKNIDNEILDEKGENVDDDSFHIYECTAGYVFKWTQKSVDYRYVLPMNQYTYATVYTFKKDLPICDPIIFSNYIGHIDLKISKRKIEIRSSSNKGEYVIGVDGSYFVPRTN